MMWEGFAGVAGCILVLVSAWMLGGAWAVGLAVGSIALLVVAVDAIADHVKR
jgi:hypothetical protein